MYKMARFNTKLKIVSLPQKLLISGEVWKGGCLISLMSHLYFFLISTSSHVIILVLKIFSLCSLFPVSFNRIHSQLLSVEFVIPQSPLELQYMYLLQ